MLLDNVLTGTLIGIIAFFVGHIVSYLFRADMRDGGDDRRAADCQNRDAS